MRKMTAPCLRFIEMGVFSWGTRIGSSIIVGRGKELVLKPTTIVFDFSLDRALAIFLHIWQGCLPSKVLIAALLIV